MRIPRITGAAALAAAAITTAALASVAPASAAPTRPAMTDRTANVCAKAAPGYAACLAKVRLDTQGHPAAAATPSDARGQSATC